MFCDINEELKNNYKLVYSVINRYFPPYVDDEDVFQEGLIGLWNAYTHYDDTHERCHGFATYAYTCIYNRIRSHFKYLKSAKNQCTAVVSLDSIIREEDMAEACVLSTAISNDIDYVEDDADFIASLSPLQKEVYVYLKQGYTAVEISRLKKTTRQNIDNTIRIIRRKFRERFD